MPIRKPDAIAGDPFKSSKWDEIAEGRTFRQSDAPTIALLCQWHKIAEQAMEELDNFGGGTAYGNDMGDLKAFPQIGTLKTASAEIRQLNKQLGIADAAGAGTEAGSGGNILSIVSSKRADRRARAAG